MATLLLFAPDAHAGSYSAPVYSGGTYHGRGGPNGAEGDYNYSLTSSGWSGTGTQVNDASSSGTISVTFTWQPASGQTITTDPPPSYVIVMETATASGAANVYGSPSMPSGFYDDGMGSSGQSPVTYSTANETTVSGSGSDTKYSVVTGGATVSVPSRTLTAKASGNANSATASVCYTASIVNGNWDGPYYFHYGFYGSDASDGPPWANNTAGPTPTIQDVSDNISTFQLSETQYSRCKVCGTITPVWYWNGPDLGVAPPPFWIDVNSETVSYDSSTYPVFDYELINGINDSQQQSTPNSARSYGNENVAVQVQSDEYAPGEGNGYWAIGPSFTITATGSDGGLGSAFSLDSMVSLSASIESGKN